MEKVNNQIIIEQKLKINSVKIFKKRESGKCSKLFERYSLAIEKKLLSIRPTIDIKRQPTKPKLACRVKPVPVEQQAVQSMPLQELVENIPLPVEKSLEDEINKKILSINPENTTSAQQQQQEVNQQCNPTSLSNKRAPEPLEEEPERKRIKLTIIIVRRSEGATYRIKSE